MFFGSDNTAGISAPILAAIAATNTGYAGGYGNDALTREIEARLADFFEREVTVALVTTGTAANALALACIVKPWGAVICHAEAHIMVDECGAPELFSGGAKLIGLEGHGGKLAPQTVAETLERTGHQMPHHVRPQALSLTQASEVGTVYTPDEVAALATLARDTGLGVHMDGARFANALVHLGCTPAEITWRAGVDMLCFGATKAGALAAEAVIAFDTGIAEELIYRRKRAGQLISKHRFLAAQWQGFLEKDHWRDLAAHANAMATRLAEGLLAAGIQVPFETQANEVFALLPVELDATLRAAGAVYYPWSPHAIGLDPMPTQGQVFARFVTSFQTREGDVDALLDRVRAAT